MPEPKVVLLGANGQVGSALAHLFDRAENGVEAIALTRQDLDITDAAAVARTLTDHRPDWVINAAAYTAVDRAETEPAQARLVNAQGPENIARACQRLDCKLLHLSTDYVFDGTKPTAYTEDDPPNPINQYGQSKWDGEQRVRAVLARHIILRVSWVFSDTHPNFVTTIRRLSREKTRLTVVADQSGCPTSATAIAAACARIVHPGPSHWGLYHFCGQPPTTWFGFAEAIVAQQRDAATRKGARLPLQELLPITTSAYTEGDSPTPARRPANSVLAGDKIAHAFGITAPDWRGCLAALSGDCFD